MKISITKIIILLSVLFAFQYANAQEKPKAELVDSFIYSNSEEASVKIDMLNSMLHQSPTNAGYVIVYGGKVSKRGEIEAHLRGIRVTFTIKRIDQERVPVIKGGYRDKVTIEFWIVPEGADLPQPTPTIDAKKVRFKGVSRKTIPYDCCP